jgi:type II secretory pathway pseudopilin PulG
VTTNGSNVAVTNDAARTIAIVLMLAGIGVFSVLTAAVAQRFIASRAVPRAEAEQAQISAGDRAIMERLEELSARLCELERGEVVGAERRS